MFGQMKAESQLMASDDTHPCSADEWASLNLSGLAHVNSSGGWATLQARLSGPSCILPETLAFTHTAKENRARGGLQGAVISPPRRTPAHVHPTAATVTPLALPPRTRTRPGRMRTAGWAGLSLPGPWVKTIHATRIAIQDWTCPGLSTLCNTSSNSHSFWRKSCYFSLS